MTINPDESVPAEHVFKFRDGNEAHTLRDLREAIAEMSLEDFNHHVDEFNNDFANWVEFVLKEPEIAADLKKVRDKKRALEVLDVEVLAKPRSDDLTKRIPFGQKSPVQKKEFLPNSKPVLLPKPVQQPEPRMQLHEQPITPTPPPQHIVMPDGTTHQTISTHAPHTFIVKEFLYGAIAGLVIGMVIMAILMNVGALP